MASFPGFTITASGLDMQAKAQAGGTLRFTRIALGAGAVATPAAATALADQRMTENIQSFTVLGGGICRLSAVFSNAALATGFGISEIGVFALDPTTSVERLYGYTKSATADFFSAVGGATLEEQELTIPISVGSASNVTALIDDTVILATKKDCRYPTNQDDLSSVPATVSWTVRQKVSGVYVDSVRVMGFGALAIPIAFAAVPTPPTGLAYLYVRTNGQASPNARMQVCAKLPDGNECVMCVGDPS